MYSCGGVCGWVCITWLCMTLDSLHLNLDSRICISTAAWKYSQARSLVTQELKLIHPPSRDHCPLCCQCPISEALATYISQHLLFWLCQLRGQTWIPAVILAWNSFYTRWKTCQCLSFLHFRLLRRFFLSKQSGVARSGCQGIRVFSLNPSGPESRLHFLGHREISHIEMNTFSELIL